MTEWTHTHTVDTEDGPATMSAGVTLAINLGFLRPEVFPEASESQREFLNTLYDCMAPDIWSGITEASASVQVCGKCSQPIN